MKQRIFKFIRNLAFTTMAFAGFLLTSCNNITDIPVQVGKMVKISLDFAEYSRSAYPLIERNDFKSLLLKCDDEVIDQWSEDKSISPVRSAYDSMRISTVEVPEGSHVFELYGFLSDGTSYRDEIEENVTEGSTLSFELSINKLQGSGNGSLTWDLRYPSGLGLSKISYEVYSTLDGKTFSDSTAKTSASTTISSNTSGRYYITSGVSLTSGLYIIRFKFIGQEAELGVWDEVVGIVAGKTTHLYKNLTSLNPRYSYVLYLNGGTVPSSSSTTSLTKYYSSLNPVTLEIPSKADLTFAGWYESSSFTGDPIEGWESKTRMNSFSLFAKWISIVSFDANDSEESPASGAIESVSVLEGSNITLPSNTFTRPGYVFTWWNTVENPTESTPGIKYHEKDAFTASKNTTLYAQWKVLEEGSHAVSFVTGVEDFYEPLVVTDGSTVSEDDVPSLTKANYTFGGWYTSEDEGQTLSDTAFVFGDDGNEVTEDIVLYALWIPETYTINYHDAGTDLDFSGQHEEDYAQTHTYGSETVLDTPTKDEFVFCGWYLTSDASGAALTSLSATVYTANIDLYAKWARSVYHVSETGSSSGDGSIENPLATIQNVTGSRLLIDDGFALDYTIVIHGTVKNTSNTSIARLLTEAKSILICGATGNETDIISGDNDYYGLYIRSEVPITLRNIKISESKIGLYVDLNSAKVILEEGTLITGNSSASSGCGVYISRGIVEMYAGAKISGNTVTSASSSVSGAGVYIVSGAQFIMYGGEISGNMLSYTGTISSYAAYGAGVYNSGIFRMYGGVIKDNTALKNGTFGLRNGGAVFTTNNGFYIGGDASIPLGEDGQNNVYYSNSNSCLFISSELTADSPVLSLALQNYTIGNLVVLPGTDEITLTQEMLDKVNVISADSTPYCFELTEDGYGALARPTYSISYYEECEEPLLEDLPEVYATQYKWTDGVENLPSISKDDWVFLGWCTDPECLTVPLMNLSAQAYSSDIKLYAKWHEIERYGINYYDGDADLDCVDFTGEHEEDYSDLHTYGIETLLDTPTRDDYIFLGWYLEHDMSGSPVTSLSALDYTNTINLYAKWARNTFYVSADGDDTDGDGSAGAPYATVTKAIQTISTLNIKMDYVVVVSGELFERLTLARENVPSEKFNSLTIKGLTDNQTDKLNGNASGAVITLYTTVPVTLKDICITNGTTSSDGIGAGIQAKGASGSRVNLTLDSGTLIERNESTNSNNGTGMAIRINYGTVTMRDGAVIRDNNLLDKAYKGAAVYVYTEGIFNMQGGEIYGNKSTKNTGAVDNNSGTFNMTGGIIHNNDTNGVYNSSTFNMSGNAYIHSSNRVNLSSSSLINVTGELTAESPVAVLHPNYSEGQRVLYTSNNITQDVIDKFAIDCTESDPWYLNAEVKYAVIRRPFYNITYLDKDGGDLAVELPAAAPVIHTFGTETTLPVLERDGYVFMGWYKDSACEGVRCKSIGANSLLEDINFYALWTPKTVDIEIISNEIGIAKTEEDGLVTLTPTGNYTAFEWLIGGKNATSVITGASVSDSGVLTFEKDALVSGRTYQILLSAKNSNGNTVSTVISIRK